jgi:hypothetical protein
MLSFYVLGTALGILSMDGGHPPRHIFSVVTNLSYPTLPSLLKWIHLGKLCPAAGARSLVRVCAEEGRNVMSNQGDVVTVTGIPTSIDVPQVPIQGDPSGSYEVVNIFKNLVITDSNPHALLG